MRKPAISDPDWSRESWLSRATRPAVLAAMGVCVLSMMDATIKHVAVRHHTFEIAFLRYAVGLIFAGATLAYVKPGWPSRESLIVNGSRSFIVALTATCFFYALGALPLAETIALSFLSPIFLAIFGAVLLREPLDGRIGAALGVGLVGMLVIVGPRLGAENYGGHAALGAVAALISAVTYALAMTLLRARARRDPVVTIVFIQNIGPALILLAPALTVWRTPELSDWWAFLFIGFGGVAGHLLLAMAFARAEAARLAPLEYTALVWATLFGFLFYGETPTPIVLAGSALIVAAAFVAGRR
ncbi:DMT family transporter [Terrarubrum flagellatum]|uniref:DMT family transporter n=1 Tax=Terrirubrum flagellatum TaxID=2895980 RepID=UPI0031451156